MSIDVNQLRESLIASLHSDEQATAALTSAIEDPETLLKLCVVCAPHDEYSNDCRMQAAFYISQFSPEMLGQVIPLLAILLTVPDSGGEDMNGNIALHLIGAIRKGLPEYSGTFYHDLDKIAESYGCIH